MFLFKNVCQYNNKLLAAFIPWEEVWKEERKI